MEESPRRRPAPGGGAGPRRGDVSRRGTRGGFGGSRASRASPSTSLPRAAASKAGRSEKCVQMSNLSFAITSLSRTRPPRRARHLGRGWRVPTRASSPISSRPYLDHPAPRGRRHPDHPVRPRRSHERVERVPAPVRRACDVFSRCLYPRAVREEPPRRGKILLRVVAHRARALRRRRAERIPSALGALLDRRRRGAARRPATSGGNNDSGGVRHHLDRLEPRRERVRPRSLRHEILPRPGQLIPQRRVLILERPRRLRRRHPRLRPRLALGAAHRTGHVERTVREHRRGFAPRGALDGAGGAPLEMIVVAVVRAKTRGGDAARGLGGGAAAGEGAARGAGRWTASPSSARVKVPTQLSTLRCELIVRGTVSIVLG